MTAAARGRRRGLDRMRSSRVDRALLADEAQRLPPGIRFAGSRAVAARAASIPGERGGRDRPLRRLPPAGPALPGGRVVLLSMEPRRDGPGRPFDDYYTQTPTETARSPTAGTDPRPETAKTRRGAARAKVGWARRRAMKKLSRGARLRRVGMCRSGLRRTRRPGAARIRLAALTDGSDAPPRPSRPTPHPRQRGAVSRPPSSRCRRTAPLRMPCLPGLGCPVPRPGPCS